jgi:hypothetical protein
MVRLGGELCRVREAVDKWPERTYGLWGKEEAERNKVLPVFTDSCASETFGLLGMER